MFSSAKQVFIFCIKKPWILEEGQNLILCFNSQIRDEEVSLRVNSEFLHSYCGEPLDVEFSYNRLEKVFVFLFFKLSSHE